MKLNLCCSDQHLPGYVNVDIVQPADELVDLADERQPWPWADSSVSEIRFHDGPEHLPNKIRTMNECWRVLEPDGKLDLFVPTTDGRGAFQDPQHVAFFTPNDLFYYCEEYAEWQRFHEAYGIQARFRVEYQDHEEYANKVWKLRALLKAVKP